GADADLRHELYADRGLRIGVLEIVDQLRDVLDRVDVVVRRRRDELDAGRGIAQLGDVLGDLLAGQLAPFAGLGALRDLDLQHLGRREVLGGPAEAAGGDLLDLRFERIAGLERDVHLDALFSQARHKALAGLHGCVAPAILAALARVRPPADAV